MQGDTPPRLVAHWPLTPTKGMSHFLEETAKKEKGHQGTTGST